MALTRIQVAFKEQLSGMGADLFVNTWHIIPTGGASSADAAAAFVPFQLTTFYQSIQDRWAGLVGDADVKAYDMADPEPRSPVYETTIAVVPGGGDILPPQIALCLSYHAAYVSGVPKARQRGRIYLGGFSADSLDAVTGLVNDATVNDVTAAAQTLRDNSIAAPTFSWVIYSPTDNVSRVVTAGWVDNSWDVQRRRQLEPTSRGNFS